ncbi:MAG: 2-C-methyl-D-erythritol 2,4-cyclodiphosphate synthase [Actinomycetota bacterium]|nr:2-C-methyl-D-erythritol 2,4-cyclodiphosphate synthase [Actinomycetota bacterium]
MTEHRIGLGVDVHRFVSDPERAGGRALVLGGVAFPGSAPLEGHSDADAVAHAVADAILGAAGLGDLGSHFPDSDDEWLGADSIVLLSRSASSAAALGWRLVNADCTVVTERPRLAPAREEMSARLSGAAGGPVHVKATRPEQLGSLGRVEGLACLAVALLERGDPPR